MKRQPSCCGTSRYVNAAANLMKISEEMMDARLPSPSGNAARP